MGIALSSLFGRLFGTQEVKLLILGLDNAGKTTLLYRLLLGETVSTAPTVGSNVEVVKYRNVQFAMWDIGGQTSLRSSWSQYYAQARAVILVVDSTDKERMGLVKEELARMVGDEQLKDVPLLVFANKQDIPTALRPSAISSSLALTDLRARQWHIQASCSLTGDGLHEGLDWVVGRIGR